MPKTEPKLTPKELEKRISRSFEGLKKEMTFEEYHGQFMGRVQLIERALAGLLIYKYGYDENQLERYTLGRTITELRKCGLRKDFLVLLDDFLEYRNYIAHEILADEVSLRRLVGSNTGRLNFKHLENGMYRAIEIIHVYDFLFVENKFYGEK